MAARHAHNAGSLTKRHSLVAASHLLAEVCWCRRPGNGDRLHRRGQYRTGESLVVWLHLVLMRAPSDLLRVHWLPTNPTTWGLLENSLQAHTHTECHTCQWGEYCSYLPCLMSSVCGRSSLSVYTTPGWYHAMNLVSHMPTRMLLPLFQATLLTIVPEGQACTAHLINKWCSISNLQCNSWWSSSFNLLVSVQMTCFSEALTEGLCGVSKRSSHSGNVEVIVLVQ